jgi:hypothetical protein
MRMTRGHQTHSDGIMLKTKGPCTEIYDTYKWIFTVFLLIYKSLLGMEIFMKFMIHHYCIEIEQLMCMLYYEEILFRQFSVLFQSTISQPVAMAISICHQRLWAKTVALWLYNCDFVEGGGVQLVYTLGFLRRKYEKFVIDFPCILTNQIFLAYCKAYILAIKL